MAEYRKGLRDVIAGQTSICKLDEESLKISYRGHDLADLAKNNNFEDVAYILLHKHPPTTLNLMSFSKRLRESVFRINPEVWKKVCDALRACPNSAHSMTLLRQAVNTFGAHDKRAEFQNEEQDRNIILDFLGSIGYMVSLVNRYILFGSGAYLALMPLDFGSAAANLLYLLLGREPDALETRMMDTLMILYAEHEFNASTWGGVRIAASTHTDFYSAIINGVGNLKGLLHGGANEKTMQIINELGSKPDLEAFLIDNVGKALKKETGWKMHGFGHGVYTHGDSRVAIFKPYFRALSETKRDTGLYDLCEKIELIMLKSRDIYIKDFPDFKWWFPNIDFWAGPAYKLMGIPEYLNTPLFAVARSAGWCAHYLETRYELKEKLIRPRAEYIGPMPQT